LKNSARMILGPPPVGQGEDQIMAIS
jgi:hypothetical protein